MRRKRDGLVHFLGGHHLKVPLRSVEPNMKCPDCYVPVYRFLLANGKPSKGFHRDGEPHSCAMDPRLKYPNRKVMPERDSVGYFGDHSTHADKD